MTTVPTSHLPAGEPVLTTDVVGTDFGLPLVRPTRTRQGGRVRVDSPPGRGTTLVAELPCAS